jgi:hypothetical protein
MVTSNTRTSAFSKITLWLFGFHPGHWSVHWMKPEPMHAIETVENLYSAIGPPSVRVEMKVNP